MIVLSTLHYRAFYLLPACDHSQNLTLAKRVGEATADLYQVFPITIHYRYHDQHLPHVLSNGVCLEWLHRENQSKPKPKVFIKSQFQIISHLGHPFPAPSSSLNIIWVCCFHNSHLPRILRGSLLHPGSQALGLLLILKTKYTVVLNHLALQFTVTSSRMRTTAVYPSVLVPGFDMWISVRLHCMNEGWDYKSVFFSKMKISPPHS